MFVIDSAKVINKLKKQNLFNIILAFNAIKILIFTKILILYVYKS